MPFQCSLVVGHRTIKWLVGLVAPIFYQRRTRQWASVARESNCSALLGKFISGCCKTGSNWSRKSFADSTLPMKQWTSSLPCRFAGGIMGVFFFGRQWYQGQSLYFSETCRGTEETWGKGGHLIPTWSKWEWCSVTFSDGVGFNPIRTTKMNLSTYSLDWFASWDIRSLFVYPPCLQDQLAGWQSRSMYYYTWRLQIYVMTMGLLSEEKVE